VGVEYGQLKDNAENLKELFQTVLKRSEELDINSLYESNNVQILEEARKPGAPISPNMTLNLLIGLALGLGLGAAILALIYLLDNTVRSEHDITRYTDRPVLGTLPAVDSNMIKDLTQGQDNPLDLITHIAPRSTFAEGIKSLRTNLMFMAPDNPPKVLMVTSPGPGEGKTLISTNMAVAMAQSGLKTLLIDADMRRPRVHKALGLENDQGGLVELLERREELANVVRETPVENLHVLTCGEIPPNPAELLHADSLPGIIDEMLEMYDRVIFDSPPLGAVSDALVLSHFVESVILITKFGQTRRELLKRSIEQLVTIGAPLMGCVLNNIDTSAGGYGYYNYYYYYRYNYEEQPESKPKRKKRGEAA
jgi:capsular exopolysaccharide synthesis family protein